MDSSNFCLHLNCSHFPKTVKKIGILSETPCEILVCSKCRHDSDLQHLREEVLQK